MNTKTKAMLLRELGPAALVTFIIVVLVAAEHYSPGITLTGSQVISKTFILLGQAAGWIAGIGGLIAAGVWWERRRWNQSPGLYTVRLTGNPRDLQLAHHELDARWDRVVAESRR